MKDASSIALRFVAIVLISFLAGVFYASGRPGLLIAVCLLFVAVQCVNVFRTLTSPKYTRRPPEPEIRLNLD